MLKTLAKELWERVILSYKSTFIGIAAAIGVWGLDQITHWLSSQHWALAPGLMSICVVIGAVLKTKELTPSDPVVIPPPPPVITTSPPKGGFASVNVLVLLATLTSLALPGLARSDTSFGGCLNDKDGKPTLTCLGPTVAVSLVAIDLQSGAVSSSFSPGLGYGISWNTGRWQQIDIDLYATFRDTASGQALVPSLVLGLAQYIRLGIGIQVGKGNKPFGLLGVGTGFGVSPAVAVATPEPKP